MKEDIGKNPGSVQVLKLLLHVLSIAKTYSFNVSSRNCLANYEIEFKEKWKVNFESNDINIQLRTSFRSNPTLSNKIIQTDMIPSRF